MPEFLAYAKANSPSMSSAGNGSPQHIFGELFKMLAGVDLVHVPYRGGASTLTDLLGGQVQLIFSHVPEAIEYIKAGQLRPLAVTTQSASGCITRNPYDKQFSNGIRGKRMARHWSPEEYTGRSHR